MRRGGIPGYPYEIQWLNPNKLSYPILAVGMWIGGTQWGPRLGLLGCGIVFVGSLLWLAKRLGRPLEHAALASVFLYSACYYAGLLNFLVGALPFALWVGEIGGQDREEPELRRFARLFGIALLLYLSHALWLAIAGLMLLFPGARCRRARTLWLGGLALTPFLLATLVWYAGLADRRWGLQAKYYIPPLQR